MTEGETISKFFDNLLGALEALQKVPQWRLFIAFFILGEDVTKKFKEVII